MGDFRMPSLGADMERGQLIEWLVKVGDPVHRGDIVAVVETPKSTVEVECFETGTVAELVVEEGQTVPVGAVLAHIGEPVQGRAAPVREVPVAATPAPVVATPAPVTVTPAPVAKVAPEPARAKVAPPTPARRLSPVLRHLAHELGVDPTTLRGTGPDGTLTRHDLEEAAAAHAHTHRARVSPLARRLAAEAGVDLARVVGTG
ncbi:dehydrogenase, partial [Intrasporangium oryzae NRRL B-24470]